MTVDRHTWIAARHARWQAACALQGPHDAAAWIAEAWPGLSPARLASILPTEPPPSIGVATLVAWHTGEAPIERTAPSLRAWDRAMLDRCTPSDASPQARRAAVWAWLHRMGEEVEARHVRAWEDARPAAHAADSAVFTWWTAMLDGRLDADTASLSRSLLRQPIAQAFTAVCRALRLPDAVRSDLVQRAVAQLDDVALGAHLDLATRTLEAQGAPVPTLAAHLTADAWRALHRCAGRRGGWQDLLSDGADARDVPEAMARLLVRRLVHHASQPGWTTDGRELPGWSVVQANHDKVRGRLRALLRAHPEALGTALDPIGIAPRTRAAARRWAWDWAWREARLGFPFAWDGALAPPCVVGDAPPPLEPLGPEHADAVTAWLVTILGRGCWHDLERWLAGAPGRSLSASFYRYLGTAPDALADPGSTEGRARTYRRLQDHLSDGGLAPYVPRLRHVAQTLAAVPEGRGLRQRVAEALAPVWTDSQPMPEHSLTPFVHRCASFLRAPPN